MARIIRPFLRQSALTIRRRGVVRVVAAALLVLACNASLSTTIAWPLRGTEVLRLDDRKRSGLHQLATPSSEKRRSAYNFHALRALLLWRR
jgi:hypothetical protein